MKPDLIPIEKYKDVIKYVNESNYIIFDWSLGNYCNYNCSYCYDNSNTGTLRVPPLEEFSENLNHIYDEIERIGRVPYFVLNGGEPTMVSSLPEIIKRAKERFPDAKCMIVTNGSRTLNYWEKNKDCFDHISISYHIDSAEKEHILEVCKILQDKNVSITIMLPNDERFEKGLQIQKWFLDNDILSYSNLGLKLLQNNAGKALLEYTEEQKKLFQLNYRYVHKKNNNNSFHPFALAITNDGKTYRSHDKFLTQLQPDFTGWDCYVGSEKIMIRYSGLIAPNCWEKVYNENTKMNKKYYNIFKDDLKKLDFKISTEPVKCTVGRCRCVGSYNVSKTKN